MAKKDNTMLWVLGLAGVGAVAYFGFIKPKQMQPGQQALPTTSAASAEAERLRAQAALVKAQTEAQPEFYEEVITGVLGGVLGLWG